MKEEQQLQAIRARIDELDEQIQKLISQRAVLAREVAEAKRGSGEEQDFYRPEREAEILRKIRERNEGPLDDEEITRLFREIMSACLALEAPLNVAYFGPEGTFTQAATLKHFGHSVKTLPLASIEEVFREVTAGGASFGVVPVENSTEGVVNHTLDSFMNSSLRICGEVGLRIHHHLLGKMDSLKDIRQVVSHPQSLAQCRKWLDSNLAGIERLPVSSNGEAAQRAAREAGVAAIAGQAAAETYGLSVLGANIEDEPDNTTRFLVIGHHTVPPSGADKTSLLLSARNRPGALYRLLKPFADHDISLTRIESRPSGRNMWDYVFFVDIEGHVEDDEVAAALRELEDEAAMLKVLGSYPKEVM